MKLYEIWERGGISCVATYRNKATALFHVKRNGGMIKEVEVG